MKSDYFKSIRDYYIFVLLYTAGSVRDELLNLANISDYEVWYKSVRRELFPIKSDDELKALDILTSIYEEIDSKYDFLASKLAQLAIKNNPTEHKKDTFIILESGIDFSNNDMCLCDKVFLAFPSNSEKLQRLNHYCLDVVGKRFYCLKDWAEETKPFSFKDIESETGYTPAIGADRATAGIKYLQENKLIEGRI
jgi:hypothetical protein